MLRLGLGLGLGIRFGLGLGSGSTHVGTIVTVICIYINRGVLALYLYPGRNPIAQNPKP